MPPKKAEVKLEEEQIDDVEIVEEEKPQRNLDLNETIAGPTGDKRVTFDKAIKEVQATARMGEGRPNLVLHEKLEDGKTNFNYPPMRWVLAKFNGTQGNTSGFHQQTVNGIKAKFPLGEWVVTRFFYVANAFQSGNVDFTNSNDPRAKNMRMVSNTPDFEVKDSIEEEYQNDADVMKWIEEVAASHGKRLPLSTDSI